MATKPAQPQVTATTILGSDQFVTGVRGMGGPDVLLSGTSVVGGVQSPLLYVGPVSPTNPGGVHILTPSISGQSISGATFYGPDTFAFNPSLGAGNVRAVGCYTYDDSGTRNHGLLYQGPPAGGGIWTQIDVPSSAVGGKIVENTLAHSTMGDLVVGNYDLQKTPASANAFVYNIAKKTWTIFDFGGTASLTTAYGIWQNRIGGPSYVIVGGSQDGGGVNKGYVVNYDSETGAFTNLKFYSALNQPSLVTHFEGVTATPAGFNLAALSPHAGMALLASISVRADGSFSEASWLPFAYPSSVVTTGNTVHENVLMGIYAVSGAKGVQSYAATIG
ncbi:MAG TPA: hypothetical protein VII56_00625 [Rhizomicrobium sp.]